jgi:hypothetical protein
MANGRITSGGAEAVKTYTRNGDRMIEVKYLMVDGANVIITLGPAGETESNPRQAPGREFSQLVPAPLGRRTLIVQFRRGDVVDKEITQQINVVAG